MPNNASDHINIEVVSVHDCQILSLSVKIGSTIEDAILQSGICERFPQIILKPTEDEKHHAVGIFGEIKSLDTLLQAGDRVEIYQPLWQSPMLLRKANAPVKKPQRKKPRQRPVKDPR